MWKKKFFYIFLWEIYEIKANYCHYYTLECNNVHIYSYLQINLATKLIEENLERLVNLYNSLRFFCLLIAKEFVTQSADFYLFSTL